MGAQTDEAPVEQPLSERLLPRKHKKAPRWLALKDWSSFRYRRGRRWPGYREAWAPGEAAWCEQRIRETWGAGCEWGWGFKKEAGKKQGVHKPNPLSRRSHGEVWLMQSDTHSRVEGRVWLGMSQTMGRKTQTEAHASSSYHSMHRRITR